MNPSRPFILRPIATSLLMAGLLLVGAVAYKQLPVSALPQVDYPTIQVMTFFPGASPDVMTSAITAPLERQFGQLPGLNQMTSTSSGGSSLITLQFGLDLNIDVAEQEVQAAINAASSFLPADLPNPPIYSKTNPADAPILTLALTSKTLPLSNVEDLADTRLAQKISQLSGVGLVSISGGQKPAVRIQVNPTALSSYGLTLETLRGSIAQANVNQAKGNFDGAHQAYTIGANDQLISSNQYGSTIVAYRNGAPVRLSDVATVIDGVENNKLAAWTNQTPAVIVNIQRQPGANIIAVVDRIKALLPQLKSSLPAAVNVSILTDRTNTIRASVEDVQFELMLTVALVVMVIFLFLRTLSATVIPSIAVPLSIVGTFGVMYLLGYSLNNLSLMALTISTGFVVDDAIVMIENIMRYIEDGDPPLQAALKGSEQIGFTILSLTISLIAVLIPLLFMGDIVGRLFREFAVTLSVTILVSAVVSLTLTPVMCAKFLRHKPESQQGRFYRTSENMFKTVIEFYGRTLTWVLRRQTATLWVAAATLVCTVLLYVYIPKGFFPVQDTGVILGISEAPQAVSFTAMAERQQSLARVILKDPAVESLSSFIGADGTNTTLNSGRVLVNLKPIEIRKISASDVIRRLQLQLAKVDGITLFMQPVQDLTVEDRVSRTQFQYSLESPDPKELALWVPRFIQRLQARPELRDVASDQSDEGLGVRLVIDRDAAARLGINAQTLDDTLYDAFGQRQISTIFTQLNQYRVVMEVKPNFQRTPDDLNNLYVQSSTGGSVPLGAFSQVERSNAPLTINHQGQFPVVNVSFNLAPGASLGQAVQAVENTRQSLGLPASIQTGFQGTAQAFRVSLANEPFLILAALITVYIVLGVLYESYIHPVTILSTLPSAGVGALLALILCRTEFSVIALIGIILLIGIVKKNAIMMIDFALDAERQAGKSPVDAIYQACLLRFRPIMMTTMAALLGAVPLAFSSGTGAELRRPLGISIIGGLLLSQLLTLYTTPVIYLAFDRIAKRATRRRSRRAPTCRSGSELMNFSALFIQRPVATTLLTVAVGLAGTLAYFFLPVSPLPQVDFPTIQVQGRLPGASPETMASSVATPLERQFGRIAGITEMTSSSSLGSSSVVLQFDLNRNIDAAARDVQAAINAARSQLPPNLPSNPSYKKVNPADAPVLMLALTSDFVERARIYDLASSVLQQKLSQVDGVGEVDVGGGALPAVRIDANPTILNHYGLGLEDLRAVLNRANANRPKGALADDKQTWWLSSTDQLLKADAYRPLIITYRNGGAVRVGDVATVTDSVEDIRTGGLANGKPAVLLIVYREPGANIIDTVDRVMDILPLLRASIPPTVKLSVVLNATTTIRASVHDVEITLLISLSLVILVVFLFLRSARSTLIPSIAVPVSLLGTFGGMYLLGYSLDNLSLMALTIATGFVVDDAIVVIENITRHLEHGMTPLDAALLGAREIGFTVVSISISLIAVFIPILMMGGIVGRLFREFAVTLSLAIAVSMLVSLTLTPMMCAKLLRGRDQERHGRFYQNGERLFQWLLENYRSSLTWVLRHQPLTLAVTLLTMVATTALYVIVPKGFFPQQDTGRISGSIVADQDTSFQSMRGRMTALANTVKRDPAVAAVMAFNGGGFGRALNTGNMFITLKPLNERGISADRIVGRLRGKLAQFPGVNLYLQPVQDLRVGGRRANAQYQYTLQSDNVQDLLLWAPRMLQKLRTLPGLLDVNSDQQDKGLQAGLVIDRATASRLGISVQAIDNVLYDAFGQRQVSTMFTSLNQYHVVLEVEPQYWQTPDGLKNVYVAAPAGSQMPLSTLTHYQPSTVPLVITHQGQFPSVTLSFNLAPGLALGDAVSSVEIAGNEIGLPSTIHGSFQGTAQAFQSSLANEPLLIAAALMTVYIVLGVLYESMIHPITILSTLPSAGVGALLALLLCRTDLSVIALIGIILLIGIVKKNAIMMIDFALEAERSEGKNPADAIFQACLLRFRPIMMTTMAALLGGLPLALGGGVGSELRRPLGIAIVGGLVFSQMLTLYTTPVTYLYMERCRLYFSRLRQAKQRLATDSA